MADLTAPTLLAKLDAFIRKYYTNKIIRGVLYSAGLILAFYLVVALLEAVGHFDKTLRTLLFWSFLGVAAFLLVKNVFVPAAKLLRLGKTLSYAEASAIVGDHFPQVRDKLLNTLQLQEQHGSHGSDSLLAASIEQRTRELSPVPFTAAIDFGENRKYLKFILPPLGIMVVLLFAAPSLLTESTERLIRHNEDIAPVAPFSIEILNDELQVAERENFTLRVDAEGAAVPEKIYLEMEGIRFRFNPESKTRFSYTFRNPEKSQRFRIYADGFYFGPYDLEVLSKPLLVNFSVDIEYPAYTGIAPETIRNSGDLRVPEGSALTWLFETRNSDQIRLRLADSVHILPSSPQGSIRFQSRILEGGTYSLSPENASVGILDSMVYRISLIPDRAPSIAVDASADSIRQKDLFFTGQVQDDYGFRKLTFNYAFTASGRSDRELNTYQSIVLPKPAGTDDRFFYHWSLEELGIDAGENLSYFFEVWDNDAVNGSKSARSALKSYKAPSLKEVRDTRDQENEEIKDQLEENLREAGELKDELDELRKELMQKESLNWQDKQKLEDMLKKQKELQESMREVQEKNKAKQEKQSSFETPNEQIKQKQEQLQKLMDQVMNEELQKLMDEIQKLMEEMNKEELQQEMEEMQLSTEDLEKELDRALEQFKQLEWEQKMNETIEELEKLAEEQEELAEKSKDGTEDAEELKKEQDALNEQFEQVKDDLKKLEEMNQELENPNGMPDTEQDQEEVEENMQESSEQLDKNKKKKASESQQNAAEKMKEMAQNMEQAMAQDSAEQAEEDMDALRALLENIITLSFDQEGLMNDFGSVEKNDPKYVAYGQVQRKLKDDSKMVEDSLFALSKRIFQLEPIVNREIGLVNKHMADALEHIGERQTNQVRENQQYVMTSFNNLALLLDEALKAMQEQMANQKPGQGSCNKPGGNGSPKPSAGDLKKMQEALSKQLEEMKGQKGKDGKEGQDKAGQGQMSKKLAEMAAKQAAIRQMMEQLGQQLNEDGSGAGNEIKEISKEMEQLEQDIVNKKIDQQTIERQKDILIRLLKAENAERQRGQDEKRKSRSGQEQERQQPPALEEYLRQRERETEMLRTVPPSLKPYYRDKVNDYFNNLDR